MSRVLPRGLGFLPIPLSDPITVQVEAWSFNASATSVEVGESVLFKVDRPSADRSISYRYAFGDDSPIGVFGSETEAKHSYHSAQTFKPVAEIQVIDTRTRIVTSTAPREISVRELPPSALVLEVKPASASVQVGKEVSFSATLNSKFGPGDPNIRFNFFFGDTKSSGFQREPKAAYRYSSADRYSAHVEVAWRNAESNIDTVLARSADHQITVTAVPPPAPDGPPYLVFILPALFLIAMAILFAGYRSWKGRFSVRPEYFANPNAGSLQANARDLALDFEFHFSPDVSQALYRLDASEAGLIRFERITHD